MAQLPEVVAALLKPEAYPHPTADIVLAQTQMSFVFLTGEYVYKIKKPVDLGYLDYTTLEKRRVLCHREVELNRRLCPETYLGVVRVTRDNGSVQLDGRGETVEYAVKMRYLPQDRMLDRLLASGEATEEMVGKVAAKLAAFHQKAATSPDISRFGSLEAVRFNCDENFTQTEKYVGVTLPAADYDRLKGSTEQFLDKNALLFIRRMEQGRIRDCHGDLHAAHVCVADGIYIFDCIEFNDRFRYCDVASETAFLAMDLDFLKRADLSRHFVSTYVGLSGDGELLSVLDFYKGYRAYVRGKVESFKTDDPYVSAEEREAARGRARDYFRLASRYSEKTRPLLLVIAGLAGTGKSTVAAALGQRLGLHVLATDVIRKQLAGVPLTDHAAAKLHPELYSRQFSRKTYSEMFRRARQLLSAGESVVLDATFVLREGRLRARRLAEKVEARFALVECRLDENLVRQRLEKRLSEKSVSDARWEVYVSLKKEFDTISELSPEEYIIVDTSQPVDRVVEAILERLGKWTTT